MLSGHIEDHNGYCTNLDLPRLSAEDRSQTTLPRPSTLELEDGGMSSELPQNGPAALTVPTNSVVSTLCTPPQLDIDNRSSMVSMASIECSAVSATENTVVLAVLGDLYPSSAAPENINSTPSPQDADGDANSSDLNSSDANLSDPS